MRSLREVVKYCRNYGLDYPREVAVGSANQTTVNSVRETNARIVAEVGIYQGATSEKIAEYLNGRGELHLFDFEERVLEVKNRLNALGYHIIVGHGNSHKTMDSHNWSLMHMLDASPIFDYISLDGAHTWSIDALAFLLLDRLLKKNGYIDFDDYNWTLENSPTMNPRIFPSTRKSYTIEQIQTPQVRLIIELLVRRDKRYIEVVENKIFKKVAE